MTEAIFIFFVLGTFALLFGSVLKQRATESLRFWKAGWAFVLLHYSFASGSHFVAPTNAVVEIARSAALILACVSFLVAVSPSIAARKQAQRLAFAFSVPPIVFCALIVTGHTSHWLLYAVAGLVVWTVLRWFARQREHWSNELSLNLVVFLIATLMIVACVAYSAYACAIHTLAATLIGINALAYYRRFNRISAPVMTVCAGFLLWAATLPLSVVSIPLGGAQLSTVFWNAPKLFIAIGMMMTLLEEETAAVRASAEREREARVALLNSEEQLSKLVEGAPVGIYRSTRDGRILFGNPALLKMLGVETFEDLSRLDIEETPLQNIPRSEFRRSLEAQGFIDGLESLCTRRDGSTISIREQARVVYSDEGEVLYYEGIVEDVTERKRLHDELLRRAYHDPLTGLANRTLLEEHLEKQLARGERSGTLTALICVDLDGFKNINDNHGHDAGDEVLRQVAERVGQRLRASDTFARMGGDEFMIILSDVGSPHDVEVVSEAVLDTFYMPFVVDGVEVSCGASLGIALHPLDARSPSELRRKADQALYRAKQYGRNRYELYSASSRRSRFEFSGQLPS